MHRTREQKLALGIEVQSKEDRRRQNQQRQKEFAEKYQRKKGAAEKNPLSVLQKAYLYQNLVDEFGAEPGGMAISQISFFILFFVASIWPIIELS